MLSTILTDAQKKFDGVVKSLKEEMSVLRVGRASPALVENLSVSAYESQLTIKELATISVPEPNLIVISPWDATVKENIAAAIREANLGFNPMVDGDTIKVPVPRLSEERRKEMVKKVRDLAQEAKVETRRIRQEKIKSVEEMEKESKISEDELFRFKEDLQKLVEQVNEKVDGIKSEKEKELMGL
ncbi:ribosome recycling factor [candidate division CPR3 bacterium 4484_211]|uniref:Ribosome-recycling factor n=1 Tax=candidate division CPR3 bacterium 4484_211 TaxID=1968527 RepID=A0A1W9NY41_UNCC3|nr:MAG: ribosome recycling factor [candidate division CPR3 bacterium 4484_211]